MYEMKNDTYYFIQNKIDFLSSKKQLHIIKIYMNDRSIFVLCCADIFLR